jgi:heat shock protein HslJ
MNVSILKIVAVLFVACNPLQKNSQMKAAQELSGNYEVYSLYKKAVIGKKPTMSFDFNTKQISGNAACNGFGGAFSQTNDQLTFGPFRATKMYCSEPIMQTEKTFFKALSETKYVTNKDAELLFLDAQKNILLQAKKVTE